jgi:hypothetical protein
MKKGQRTIVSGAWMMKSKSIAGTRSLFRACVMVAAFVVTQLVLVPLAAEAQTLPAVLQVPTSNRVAGTGTSSYNGNSGAATGIELSSPSYSVFDSNGNQYISDTGNNCVRKVDATTGTISVLAGYEMTPSSPDTCNAAGVQISATQGLMAPTGLAIDANNDLFIADSGHNCVRELASGATGSSNLTAVVDTCTNTTLQSVSPDPTGVFVDVLGDIIVSIADTTDGINQVILHGAGKPANEVCDDGGQLSAKVTTVCDYFPAADTYTLQSPGAIALDANGNFYLADTGNSCVRRVSTTFAVTTVLGQCTSDGSGTPIPNTSSFSPTGLAFGPQGYLYVANASNGTVIQANADGSNPTIIAGIPGSTTAYSQSENGIAAVDISMRSPTGVTIDPSGNPDVVDTGHGIVLQLAYNNQFPAVVLPNSSAAQTLWFEINSAVNLTPTTGADYTVSTVSTTCTGAQTPSATATPYACKVTLMFKPAFPGLRRSPLTLTDSSTSPSTAYEFGLVGLGEGANALFIPGTINTLLGSLNTPSAEVVDSAGDVYFAETGSPDIKVSAAGSGTATTLVPAGGVIQSPVGLALDSAQNLYVADNVANSIFKVDPSGNVTTVASLLNTPVAVAVDKNGNLYVALDGGGSPEVMKIYAGGEQLVVAGGGTNTTPDGMAATQAEFLQPSGLYLDANGVLYISDETAYRVYDVDTSGIIHYFAGNGTQTTSDLSSPTGVGLQGPSGLVGDAAGDVYIADGPGHVVYVVLGGQTPGIQTIVGTGTSGNSGDGAAANLAQVSNPVSVALDGYDNLYVADSGNNDIREVTYENPTLNFGYVELNTTAGPLSTILWDSGNETLTPLTTFPVAPSSAPFTQVSNGCGGALLSGATCSLSYEFTPTAYGIYTAQASSNAQAPDQPEKITLTGQSPEPDFATPNVTAVYGQMYTLMGTITSGTSGAPAPTGTITFSIGAQTLCTGVAVDPNGVATCSPSPTLENVGVYTVTVAYSGDSNYPSVTKTPTLTITKDPVTITAGNASRAYNVSNPTSVPDTITPQYPFPSGQSITDDPTTYTTSAVLLSPPGSYPIVPGPAVAGTNTLLSNYAITYINGKLTITGGVSNISPAVSAVYSTAYTLTSTFTSPTQNGPAPTGTATFSIGGQPICATATLVGGVATCTPSPTRENVGVYTVSVAYSGDSTYPPSIPTIALTITQAPVTITANNATRPYNTPNPTFTGTVKGVASGQSISATFTTTATQASAPGTYPITPKSPVAGTGTLLSNYSITLVNGILTISSAATGPTSPVGSFTISATPPEQEIDLNGTVNYPVKLTSVDGFTDTVSFSCSGLPEGASCAFAPGTLKPTAGGTSTTVLTIGATVNTDNVPPGSSGYLRSMPANPAHAPSSFVLAWTMLPFGFGGSAATLLMGRRRKRSGRKAEWVLWLIPVFLLLAGLSGCATPHSYKVYTVTITATDHTYAVPVSESTTIQLVLARQ